ncbi:nuclear receptor-binding protein 2 isoform X2 [Rhinolophus sinicus]|uniref:nuclear receptor-binding protein 2 isoform X2 n=1 Tax=Rhinolophus sinicus TaxID=89399 RepID=UPI0009437137|nr:PREDICTED: nuclear receptor-binding protein 2 isoform X1 [Rhinolophus sinicus]
MPARVSVGTLHSGSRRRRRLRRGGRAPPTPAARPRLPIRRARVGARGGGGSPPLWASLRWASSCRERRRRRRIAPRAAVWARRAMAAPEPAPRRSREREREDESEDESDILEESPCGRWQKRREQVNQGNMPGVQSTFLAMDTEEGVEVVWNELHFSDRKAFSAHEEKIQTMFEQLALLDHPNIVKLHKYWLDASEARARVVFITEYVSSGSLKQFLKKTKKNHKAMNARAWKRWCTQILSALSFLHACNPPIIHGNLTSDTIFIQHNGLIKIGSVWHRIFSNALPVDLRSPIRAEREEPRNLHFFPPEYSQVANGTAVDIFSFGMCALEMAVLEIQANGDTRVTEEAIARARHSLSDPNMREFILCCLARDPARRPSAHSLLFHRVLFEVHSLKLLAAHCFIQHQYLMPENVVEDKTKSMDLHAVLAEIPRPSRPPLQWRYSEVSCLELDKFLEDVRNGIYPLMNFAAARPLGLPRALAPPPEEAQKAKTPTPEPFDSETRKVIQMQCNLERSEDKARWHLTLLLVLEDRLHRQLTYDLLPTDSAQDLAAELVHYGFVHEDDRPKLATFLESTFLKYHGAQP